MGFSWRNGSLAFLLVQVASVCFDMSKRFARPSEPVCWTFLGLLIQHLSYGSWLNPAYFILTAIIVAAGLEGFVSQSDNSIKDKK